MIGSGNVGTHLAKVLFEKGYEIVQVFSRDKGKAALLANQVNAEAITDLNLLRRSADLYILAVKDDAILELSTKLKLSGIVVHTSGTASMESIAAISDKIGVFYPLQTFSRERNIEWYSLPICLEANKEDILQSLEHLAKNLSNCVVSLSSEDRRWLHLAAVFVNNFANHLLLEAKTITDSRNIPFEILRALAVETALKAFSIGPFEAQTGPAKRGDSQTLQKQLNMLPDENIKIVYRLLSEAIQKQKS